MRRTYIDPINFIRLVLLNLAVLLCFSPSPAASEAQNPELRAHIYTNVDDKTTFRALTISKLDIDVEIQGDTARTTTTATFENPGTGVFEADYFFDMPAKSIATGYALDVGGKLVDGVLVGHEKGKLVYEARVRRGIDPGLAEVTRTNAFHTRVYPLVANKPRTVRLEFVSALDPDASFIIPLSVSQNIGVINIHVTASGLASRPHIQAPDGIELAWTNDGKEFEATGSASNRTLSGSLQIGPLSAGSPLQIGQHKSGESFFEIDDVVANARAAANPGHVRIYWDKSLSRRDDDLKTELALLQSYLDHTHPSTIDLVLFADAQPELRSFAGSSAELIQTLRNVTYRGATSMAAISVQRAADADVCLYFSDGNITIDSYRVAALPCETLFAVSSANDANRALLTQLARQTAGDYVDLTSDKVDVAVSKMLHRPVGISSVQDSTGRALDYVVLPGAENRFRIVGPLPDTGDIVVTLNGNSRATRRYKVQRDAIPSHDALGAMWGMDQLSRISASDRPDQDQLLAISRRYSIANPRPLSSFWKRPKTTRMPT